MSEILAIWTSISGVLFFLVLSNEHKDGEGNNVKKVSYMGE